jgi:hypothetical protein
MAARAVLVSESLKCFIVMTLIQIETRVRALLLFSGMY